LKEYLHFEISGDAWVYEGVFMANSAISISGASVVESANLTPQLQFVVTLSEPAVSTVDVSYRTLQGAGTALNQKVDYFEKQSFVRFLAGDTSAIIKIQIQDVDNLQEADESIVVELFDPRRYFPARRPRCGPRGSFWMMTVIPVTARSGPCLSVAPRLPREIPVQALPSFWLSFPAPQQPA